jgi:hypothetical protein
MAAAQWRRHSSADADVPGLTRSGPCSARSQCQSRKTTSDHGQGQLWQAEQRDICHWQGERDGDAGRTSAAYARCTDEANGFWRGVMTRSCYDKLLLNLGNHSSPVAVVRICSVGYNALPLTPIRSRSVHSPRVE